MIPHLFVLDEFLPDPHAVREKALTFDYAVPGRFPGLNSRQKIKIPWLEAAISRIVGEHVHAPWTQDFSHGNCRLALDADNKPARIHIDESDWTGVLTLTLPEHCRGAGGTEFYRHVPTNTDRLPINQEKLRETGYSTYDELKRDVLDRDALDRSKWELSMRVPMRFNRLVLVQPQYWHTAGESFGNSVEDGRLVYLMFFKRGLPPNQAATD
jgi:hypothetical protein